MELTSHQIPLTEGTLIQCGNKYINDNLAESLVENNTVSHDQCVFMRNRGYEELSKFPIAGALSDAANVCNVS